MKPSDKSSNRGLAVLLSVFFLFACVILRLGYLQIIKEDYYSALAAKQRRSDTVINALRGTVYDKNMKPLAQSASVWLVYVNPSQIKTDETRELIAENLSVILEVDKETIKTKLSHTQNGYEKIKGQIEKDKYEAVSDFIDKYGLEYVVCIDPDSKRYYPNSNFCSAVIGFTGSEDTGRSGLEFFYNDTLTGTPGRIITEKDGRLEEMPDSFESTNDAIQGSHLVLTLDEKIQSYLETALKQSLADTKAKYCYGIVMDVETGGILAMVSLPDYNLNSPDTLVDLNQADVISKMENSDAKSLALKDARNSQWRNRAISDTYEPGSVFKVITVSAALEENVANENYPFNCTGSILNSGHTYRCWKAGGHGSETLKDLLKNSCNPFAITIAKAMGIETFYKYFSAFGFTEKTGIDLPGEADSVAGVTYYDLKKFGNPELASYSFGQTFQVSPIQMITAISCVANGGVLMKPFIVDKVIDEQTNIVKKTEPIVKRQVISQSTADRVCKLMEDVVATGTGKNAFVPGYHVAGKTGTSDKLTKEGEYIASFAGFAPAYDPKVAILIVIDEPQGDHGGGAIAAPVAGEVFEKVLPYLNVEPKYSNDELVFMLDKAPNLIGKTVSDAKTVIGRKYTVEVVGNGANVKAQLPEPDRMLSKNGVIVLYTEDNYEHKTVSVPNFSGLTVQQANRLAVDSGLNIKISGSSLQSSDIVAYKQSIEKDTTVNKGAVITVYFKTTVGVNDFDH